MVPLGSPVVPEVKPIKQTSSLAVSQGAKVSYPGLRISSSNRSGARPPQ